MTTFAFLMIIISSFIIGWQYDKPIISIAGAYLYLIMESFRNFITYKVLKQFNNKTHALTETDNKDDQTITSKLNTGLLIIIVLTSLIGTLFYTDKSDIKLLPAALIWVGTILIYFIQGIILREVGNIQVKCDLWVRPMDK